MYWRGSRWRWGYKKQASFGLLAAIAVGALLFACYSFVEWQLNAGDASSYATAPYCGTTATNGCKREVQLTVSRIYQHHYNKSDHEFVSLVAQDGSIVSDVQVGAGYSSWTALTPGTPVTAIFWGKDLVTLLTPTPPGIQTVDHPAVKADSYRTRSTFGWVIGVIFLILAVWRWLNPIQKDQSSGSSSGALDTNPATFKFTHDDDL
jgi:hypothetical protein